MQASVVLDKCPICLQQHRGADTSSLWLTVCGHIMCHGCLQHGFSNTAAMACPVCKYVLSRTSFFPHEQISKYLEMEGAIRRAVLTDLMKTGDMFTTLKDYNRFLEEVETIVYNIPNNVKLGEVSQQYARYKRKHSQRLEISEAETKSRRTLYMEEATQKAERSQRSTMLEGLARGMISGVTFANNAQNLYRPQEPTLQATEAAATTTQPTAPSAGNIPPATYTYRPVAQTAGAGLPRPVLTSVGGKGQDLVRDPQTPAQSFVTTFIRTSLPSKKRNQLQEATESSSFESECSKKPLAGCGKMKRKASDVAVNEGGEEVESKSEESETKRVREYEHATYALHASIIKELRRLGVQTEPLSTSSKTGSTSDVSSSENDTLSSSSSSSASSSASSSTEKQSLPAAFLELNSFTYPSDLFESERWGLKDVELRNWWAPSSRGGNRPCVELGTAKQRSDDSYIYLALPTDTADPSQPVVFIKHTDGRDGPVGTDDEGFPLAEFLASLNVPESEEGGEEGNEYDEEEDADNDDPYSGFISAIVAGEELPSEDEEDEDHDADQDDDEDYDEEEEDEGDD